MTKNPNKHLVAYTFTHDLLGDLEVEVQYEIEDPDSDDPFVRIHGVKDGWRWLSFPMTRNGGRDYDFNDRPARVLEQAIVALIMDEAYDNPDWTAGILREHGYEYRGEGGNDPDGCWVRTREREEA